MMEFEKDKPPSEGEMSLEQEISALMAPPQSQLELIQALERLLELAKSGALKSLMWVNEMSNETIGGGWTYSNDLFAVSGYAIANATRRMQEAIGNSRELTED